MVHSVFMNSKLTLAKFLPYIQPHYEKVAKLFNGRDAAHPGLILMARVDCASKVQ